MTNRRGSQWGKGKLAEARDSEDTSKPAPYALTVPVDGERPRPTLLTPELADALIKTYLETDLFEAQVAMFHQIHPNTIRVWLMKGVQEKAIEPYLGFAKRWSRASIDKEHKLVQIIRDRSEKTTEGDWRAAAWLLNSRYAKRWNPEKQPETGPKELIQIQDLLEEGDKKAVALVELLKDPPPELIKALRQAKKEVLALLNDEGPDPDGSSPDVLTSGEEVSPTPSDDSKP